MNATGVEAPNPKVAPAAKSAWLFVSIALNIALAVALFVVGVSRNPLTGYHADVGFGSTPIDIERTLLAAGFNGAEARELVLAALQIRANEKRPYEYWKPVAERDAFDRAAAFARDAKIRAALVEAYGPTIENEPAFAPVFRPFERSLPMLSSAEQLRLQGSSIDALTSSGTDRTIPVSRLVTASASNLELTGGALFEYQVRESVLARALTSLRFDFTEKEFRDVFRALESARPAGMAAVTTASFAELLTDEAFLRSCSVALGDARFAEFLRTRDPAYGLLSRIAAQRGIRPAVVDQAYALLARNDARNASVPSTRVTSSIALRELDPEMTRRLESMLGTEATADVVRTFTLYRRSFSAGSPLSNAASLLSDQPFRIPTPRGADR